MPVQPRMQAVGASCKANASKQHKRRCRHQRQGDSDKADRQKAQAETRPDDLNHHCPQCAVSSECRDYDCANDNQDQAAGKHRQYGEPGAGASTVDRIAFALVSVAMLGHY